MNFAIAAVVAAFGVAEGARAQLLNPLRVVDWSAQTVEFRPQSFATLIRSMRLENAHVLPLPRYLEFRSDLVRIGAATFSEWYLIPLAPNPLCENADCGVINRDER